MAEEWRECLEDRGLKVNRIKTVCMSCEFDDLEDQNRVDIEIDFQQMEQVKSFKYLGSVVQDDGDMDEEITNRIKSGWSSWRKCRGILCDKRMPLKLKSRIQQQVIRPAMLYGSEAWVTKTRQEARLDVSEMRMLRWQCGVTRRDRIRNEFIRGSLKIAPISTKVKESRLRWYGHLRRRPEDHPTRRMMELDPPGPRKRGRPKLRWLDCVRRDMRMMNLTDEIALNRNAWKRKIQDHCSDPK